MTLSHPATGFARTLTGTLVRTTWEARVWAWEADPLEDLDAWRREAEAGAVVPLTLDALDFDFRARSPVELGMLEAEAAANAGITNDRFGTIATTTIPLTRRLAGHPHPLRRRASAWSSMARSSSNAGTSTARPPTTAVIALEERRDVSIRDRALRERRLGRAAGHPRTRGLTRAGVSINRPTPSRACSAPASG
jgi:hypothetical protein